MADYCTLSDVRAYVGAVETSDDTLVSSLITRASKAIDNYCRRTFVARVETRSFDANADVDDQTLYLDDDLLGVITLTNGDGTAITSSQYVLLPANDTPKYAVRLKSSSSVSWTYNTDPEEAISLNGTWGFENNTVPADDIKHAAIRLTAWYYHQRNAPFEAVGFPEVGQVVVPSAMPEDIKALLGAYVRARV